MKIFKKLTSIAAAAAIAAGMSTVSLFAETAYTLRVDSESASVGETVAVNVVIDAGSTGVGAISFKLNYDPEELKLISAKPGDDLKGWITGDVDSDGNNSLNLSEAGTIGFGYATMGSGFSGKSASLINASFTVLKPNARFTLTEVVIGANDMDGTDITEQGSFEDSSVIECSHKNTEENVTEATCKDEGKRDVTCKDCGKLVKTETIAKTNEHAWNNGIVTTEPTCTNKGVKTFTCSVCNETKTEEIAALEHRWGQGETTTEPTCTENGIKTFTCSICNGTKTEEIAAIGHDWGEWTVTEEATADKEGEEARECDICGEKETRSIGKLPPAPIVTTPSYTGGEFRVPDTSASASESAAVTTTTAAPANNQTAAATTTAATVVTSAFSDSTTVNMEGSVSDTYGTTDASNTGNAVNVGNADDGNTEGKNVPTGIILSVLPAATAAVGVILSKKRK